MWYGKGGRFCGIKRRNNKEIYLGIKIITNENQELEFKLEKEKFVFKVQTGKSEMMFGQISSKQIKKSLDEKGYTVSKTQIKMDHPITSLGMHEVVLELHKQVSATIKVKVEKES